MHSRFFVFLRLAALVAFAPLALSSTSCGVGNDDGSVTLLGAAIFPDQVGGGAVANTGFRVVDLETTLPVAEGVTDLEGKYLARIPSTSSVAIIVTSSPRVSGLQRGSGGEKDFDGITDIACEAGVTAVLEGAIDARDLTRERIGNLETAAAQVVGQTNFNDPDSVTASANEVRRRTNDGANPPP